MFRLFLEVSLYALPAAIMFGVMGYVLPGLLWVALLSAVVVLIPIIIWAQPKGNLSRRSLSEVLFWLSNLVWSELALWLGFLLKPAGA